MDRNPVLLYKTLIVGVIILFISVCIPPAFANDITIGTITNEENNDNLPDLIIEDFYLYSRIPEWGYYQLWATIKNIGNAPTLGEFQFKVKIYRLIFRKIPFPVRQWDDIYRFNNDTIMPDESQSFCLGAGDQIPRLPGFYRIVVTINMDKNIEESNYYNNDRIEQKFRDFVYWW
jgi:hypothetical protein